MVRLRILWMLRDKSSCVYMNSVHSFEGFLFSPAVCSASAASAQSASGLGLLLSLLLVFSRVPIADRGVMISVSPQHQDGIYICFVYTWGTAENAGNYGKEAAGTVQKAA